MHRNHDARPHQGNRMRGTLRSHGEVTADAGQHHIHFVVLGNESHVGKDISIARVINGRSIFNLD